MSEKKKKDVKIDIVEPGLANVLKDITIINNNTDTLVKIYLDPYNLLVKHLRENEEVPGLMSQAVVPDLIQKMAKISKENKNNEITLEHLYNQLTDPTKVNPPQADYPYSQTRILEMLVEIHGNPEDIPSLPKANLAKFKDPLLAAAVRIADNMTKGGEVKLGNTEWVRNFSTAVNQIQDVIVRHMIYAEVHLIPLMGDDSIPTSKVALLLSPADKETRALGLGENPNPEMAAILNPALVMSKEKRGKYLRELELLSSLISPQGDDDDIDYWDKKLKRVFGYAGFEFLEVKPAEAKDEDDALEGPDVFEEFGELDVNKLLQQINNLQAKALKSDAEITDLQFQIIDLNQTIINLGTENKRLTDEVSQLLKTKSGTPATAKPAPAEKKKEEPKTDYNLKALEYLIDYLGLDANIPPLVAQWFELDDLTTTKSDDIRATINIELSNLIHGHESLTIRREIKTKDEHNYETPTDDALEPIVTPLDHGAVIESWRNLLSKEKNEDVKPVTEDLIYVNVEIDAINAGALKKELDVKIIAARKESSGSNISTATTTIDYTKKLKAYPNNNNGLRRNKNRRGAGDRVLVW